MRVVLVRLSALGDIVHTWPLAAAIRHGRPDAHLTWVVERAMAPLVDGHPAVDAVITVDTRRWRRRPLSVRSRAELAMLRSRFAELDPDLTIDAQGTLKSALITRSTRARRRVGLARPWRRERIAGLAYTDTVAGSTDHRHVVATNLELVRAVGGEPPRWPVVPDGRWLTDSTPVATVADRWQSPFAVLLPGAGHARKVLATESLAAIAVGLVERGLQTVVAWGPAEAERASRVAELAGPGTDTAPPTDLVELAALLRAARLVVGGDTGPVHLAASLGTPTVGVFLTTDPDRNGPLGPATAVVSGAARHAAPTGSATTRALRSVGVDEVLAAVDRLLQRHE